MVGRFYNWLMSDPVTETARVDSSLTPEAIRTRLQGQIIEGHNIMIFGLLALAMFGKRHFMGRIYNNQFELTHIRSLFGPEITGHIREGGIEFKSEVNVGVNLFLLMSGVYLVLGAVIGAILAAFVPRFIPYIVGIWAIVLLCFALSVIAKAIFIYALPRHHKRHQEIFEKLLNGPQDG